MNFKRLSAASLIGAATLLSPTAFAGVTGNVGVFSEYMFRGVAQEGGAQVFGGIDYAHDSGLYVGTWVSNAAIGGLGNEADFYAGYAGKIADTVGFDVGGIYYLYTEDDEADGSEGFDYYELYVGASISYLSIKYYYSPDFGNTEDFGTEDGEAHYITGTVTLPISDTVGIALQVGNSSGDGIEGFYGIDGDYTDYSITLSKAVKDGLTFSLSAIDTDLDEGVFFAGADDKPKFVVGAKQVFDF